MYAWDSQLLLKAVNMTAAPRATLALVSAKREFWFFVAS
jgi:hypothetical protein